MIEALVNRMTDMTTYSYLALGGGVVLALAVALHFTSVSRTKVPAIVVGVIGGLLTGAGLGVLAMAAFGWHWVQQEITNGDNSPPPMLGGGGGPPGMMAMMGGGPPGMRGGSGRGPNPKAQLAALVSKLDILTHKPLQITLTAEQKRKVRELIRKLDEKKELHEDEAEAKLKGLWEILNEDQRKTLGAAGYRWPDQGGGRGRGGPPAPSPNPFIEGEPKEHLESLRLQVEDKKKE